MKHPDIEELVAITQADHELQKTINALESFSKQLNNILNARQAQKVHLINDGETLRDLAVRYYDDMSYWIKLGQYNYLTSSTLTKGTEIIIPDKEELDRWQQIQK